MTDFELDFEILLLKRGPKVVPPPLKIGDLRLPVLARPVPFCFQGFLPPPLTSPRVFVCAECLYELLIIRFKLSETILETYLCFVIISVNFSIEIPDFLITLISVIFYN
ncbi:MAG: hypothetical protein UR93_C0001G0083 [Berkelbacteria bacterium GW2011_GWA2_35_9]|uniref:Uncharacterized protein n=1 Tax=Berkelbacteria bacterium GW2011_GWA2_35_9 TaxID=1618333 RepID=A0A0G0DKC1_9BACT|nr:MAG: hypothetical protein UR93_C0001G0083 [Berkelbacteria bacterium GW2011_GWA2_35_9]